MKRSELVNAIYKRSCHAHSQAKQAVDIIIEAMTSCLADNGRMDIRHFASFSLRKRPKRDVYQPKLGKKTSMPASLRIHFKPGRQLRQRINELNKD